MFVVIHGIRVPDTAEVQRHPLMLGSVTGESCKLMRLA